MNILGISCHYHDAAACLIRNGEIVAAAQEERFDRRKNSSAFPVHAINHCVQAAGITFADIDHIGFYEKPYLKFSRVLIDHLAAWPYSLGHFLKTMPHWLEDRLLLPLTLEKELGYQGKVFFIKHHLSHAASAFLVAPFEEAAILTSDAVGEWTTLAYGTGRGADIKISKEILYPHSLGLVYTAITTYLGFAAHEGEGTVMALAGCGKPAYLKDLKEIVRVSEQGSFAVDPRFFGFNHGGRMYSRKFIKRFGPERRPGEKIDERHCDMAASVQKLTEEVLLTVARQVRQATGMDRLCLAGGLFLNCVANTRILESGLFNEIFIQPAAGDAGGSLGVAAYIDRCVLKHPKRYCMSHAYLGPSYSEEQISRILHNHDALFEVYDEEALAAFVARQIAASKVVGWFQGKMEFGPRALGNRSILGNACHPGMKELLNDKVKKREPFRPYAPMVLQERAGEFFDLECASPFMLLAPQVREEKKSLIPGIVHVDGSARVQTVGRDTNPKLWRLLKAFETITGVPVIINTSFNLRGEPVVGSPEDALHCFYESDMDFLVLGNHVVSKRGETRTV